MLYLKLAFDEFKNASHDKRELSVARELGYDVLVLATTKDRRGFLENHGGFPLRRISTRRLGIANWMRPLNRILAFFQSVIEARRMNADIISGHDYVATLAAYMANYFKSKKSKIIYDSHEFELYRYDPARTEFQRKIIKAVEGFLIRRVDLTLMVGDKIADGVQEIYHLETRPTVVRNIPPYWHLEPEKSAEIRAMFLEEIESSRVLLMYHGGIMPGRGIECAIKALALLPEDTGLIVMGYGEQSMIEALQTLAEELDVQGRVLFHPAVSVADLKDYIGAVDVELVLIEGEYCASYAYSLPNKFFESIQADVPMVCSALLEMGAIVQQYDIGLLVNENDEKSVAKAVLKLREDKKLYARLKENMQKAKKELCWEKESVKLKSAIQQMVGGENNAT